MKLVRGILLLIVLVLSGYNAEASCDSTSSLAGQQPVCLSNDTLQLIGGLPTGGFYFGSGVLDSSGAFVPSQAGVGNTTISYVYTDSLGCSDTASQTLLINALPSVSLSSFDSICLNEAAITLTQGSGSTSSGNSSYSGTGVSASNLFTPSVAGVGLNTLFYTYTDSATGCSNDTSASIFVKNIPSLSLSAFNDRCIGDDTLSLTGATPSGGKFFGVGVLSDSSSFVSDSIGVFSITYLYTDPSSTCSNTTSRNIRVRALPSVSLNTINDFCISDTSLNLFAGSPVGGDYWGTGITDSTGTFSPASADTGSHQIFYRVINSFGCAATDSNTIRVNSLPQISLSSFGSICENAAPLSLSQGSSSSSGNGVYSGSGIINGVFYPSMLSPGSALITYTFTDTSTSCQNTASDTMIVNTKPSITNVSQSDYCENAPADSLNFPQPAGGKFFGTGILSDSLRFDADSSGVGIFTVRYKYIDSNSCSNTSSFSVRVNPKPSVSLSSQSDRCLLDTAFILTGQQPNGGTYSGNGIVNSGQSFSPAAAGSGLHNLKYSATNQFACTDSAFVSIKVNAQPSISLSNIPGFCEYDGRQDLSAYVSTDSSGTGVFTGQGMINNSVFSPNNVGGGTYNLKYTFTDVNSCVSDTSFSVDVYSRPNLSLSAFASYCINNASDTLSQANIPGGRYYGTGISNDSIFSPQSTGVGQFNISYTYTNANSCSDTVSRNIQVFATPNPSFSLATAICENQQPISLSGSPVGGTFSGAGVYNSAFIPDSLSPGSYTIQYAYTDSNGCQSIDSNSITVRAKPNVSLSAVPELCIDQASYTLTQGSPANGNYFLKGAASAISGANLNLYQAGSGSYQLIYYVVAANLCVDTAKTTVKINAQPNVGLSLRNSVCENAGQISLNGGSPVGGTYFGNAVVGNSFNPVTAGRGAHNLFYTYTDAKGCKDTATSSIQVDSATTVSLASINPLCQNASALLLNQGSPSGGVYSGVPGLIGGNLYPNLAGAGSYVLNYTYTNAFGCVTSDTSSIEIYGLPQVSIASQWKTCAGKDSVPLFGGIPAGGRYFGNFVDTSGFFYPDSSGVGAFLVSYEFTDSNLCSNRSSQLMIVNSLPFVGFSPLTDKCINESPFFLTGGFPFGAGGRYRGKAVDSTGIYNPSVAGAGLDTVWYIFTDANACSDSSFQNIEIFSQPSLSATVIPDVCIGSDGFPLDFVSPQGGAYSGNGVVGNSFFSSIADTGLHQINYHYTDSNSCLGDTSLLINVSGLPDSEVTPDTIVCKNTELELSVQGGISYRWQDGSELPSIGVRVLKSQNYRVTVSSAANCERVHEINIDLYDTLAIRTNISNADCGLSNGASSVNVSGGQIPYRFKWNTGADGSAIGNLSSGIYIITVSDQNGCEQRRVVSVSDIDAAQIQLDSIHHNTCYGDSSGYIAVSSNGASQFIWSNFETGSTFSNAPAGTYMVQAIDSNGCSRYERYSLNEPSQIVIDVESFLPNCGQNDGMLVAKASGGNSVFSYLWNGSTSNDTLNNLSSGVYTLEVTDSNNCSRSNSFELNDWGAPAVSVDSINYANCGQNDGAIFISILDTGSFSFVWSNSSSAQNQSNLAAGSYNLSVTDQNSCRAIRNVIVGNKLPAQPSICLVTADTALNYNLLRWNNFTMANGQRKIYRSSLLNSRFDLIADLSTTDSLYADTLFSSSLRSAEYQLKVQDNCQNNSNASIVHKSVYLSARKDGNGFVKLNWNEYRGRSISQYYIYRYRGSVGIELVDSVGSKVLNYTDLNSFKETEGFYYFIGYSFNDACGSSNYGFSNNTRDFSISTVSIEEFKPLEWSVYPNPSSGLVNIDFFSTNGELVNIKILNLQGAVVYNGQFNLDAHKSVRLMLEELAPGPYLVQSRVDASKWSMKKIVIN